MSYVRLAKPRSVLLLLVTALAGMVMAGPEIPPAHLLALTLLGGAFAAGGANVLNCYLDRDLDARTRYTARRPLPTGEVSPGQALFFGVALCVASVLILVLAVNSLSGVLAVAGALYYVLVYTWWLKRTSVWNIVIGGVAGAFPLLVGWTAVTGELSVWAFWMGAIVVLWTPPHTWALALVRQRDYAVAGVPMLPVARGERAARNQILVYAVLLLLLTLLPSFTGFVGPIFVISALLLGGLMVIRSVQLVREASNRAAWSLYKYSMVYLALLFGALILDHTAGWMLSLGAI